ncbi:Glyoxylase, beta-lactamase superfamily II [Planococcus glaciei]|uniref:MBL fold metallo-hydrolase n=1 Tax=Planococcus glaciei TaxID=459472 RepID=UPI00088CAB88|nr:MBL fold metallo-hydrolase [Planococcus glaciei]SDH82629.1 Glyoxylase, beta-lactamase superfamily II [Planococcus glaciei]
MYKQLNERIFIIDGMDLGLEERTGTYVIREEELTLIDTSASPSVPYIKKGLEKLGYQLDQVKYIIVTHIHLDHAGGAGLLLKDCPNAKIVVHPKGARHLAEPERLIAGAKQVYGDKFDKLFDPIVPIPKERLLVIGEGAQLKIGPSCTLEFWDTPGHANHHFGIVDTKSNGIFAGDTVGIRYEQLAKEGIDFFLPSTSPNQFDPEAMKHAISRMQSQHFSAIYYGHFGMTEKTEMALRQVSEWLDIFMAEAEKTFAEGFGPDELAARLQKRIQKHLQGLGVGEDHEVYQIIQLDLEVSAMGMADYFLKRQKAAASSEIQ